VLLFFKADPADLKSGRKKLELRGREKRRLAKSQFFPSEANGGGKQEKKLSKGESRRYVAGNNFVDKEKKTEGGIQQTTNSLEVAEK